PRTSCWTATARGPALPQTTTGRRCGTTSRSSTGCIASAGRGSANEPVARQQRRRVGPPQGGCPGRRLRPVARAPVRPRGPPRPPAALPRLVVAQGEGGQGRDPARGRRPGGARGDRVRRRPGTASAQRAVRRGEEPPQARRVLGRRGAGSPAG